MDDAPLSLALIEEATGEADHAQIESIEVIFTRCTSVGAMEHCASLRRLTMIDNGMVRMGSLQPVSHTLEYLCLIDQSIEAIEYVELPHLRELYLQNNRIRRIENLGGFPRLEKLWLGSNRISAIENLECCGGLRELWIPENAIARVGDNLQALPRLENLNLAGNRIADYTDIQALARLPRLAQLSLDDLHFGSNPVVHLEGYRAFAICCLPQLQRLDGAELSAADRGSARGALADRVVAFNEKVEGVQRDFEREFSAVEARRSRGGDDAEALKAEMVRSFARLQRSVVEGTGAVAAAHERQARVREENLGALEAELLGLQRDYNAEIDRRIEAEARAAAEEERLLRAAERRASAERAQASLLGGLALGAEEGLGVQRLPCRSPEFSFLASALRRQFPAQTPLNLNAPRADLVAAYRVHAPRPRAAHAAAAGGAGAPRTLFLAAPLAATAALLRDGLEGLGRDCVMLHADAELALRVGAGDAGVESWGEDLGALVAFRCALGGAGLRTVAAAPPGTRAEAERIAAEVPSGVECAAVAFRGGKEGAAEAGGGAEGGGAESFVVRAGAFARCLPEHHLLVGRGDCGGDRRQTEEALEALSVPSAWAADGDDLLARLERDCEAKVRHYVERVWEEVGPPAADRLRAVDGELRRRAEEVEVLRQSVAAERGRQEDALRGLRQQLHGAERGKEAAAHAAHHPPGGVAALYGGARARRAGAAF